ncbi:MAG: hypothetical protein QXJ28_01735 [Candidatus Pacearchaeota archaeon]
MARKNLNSRADEEETEMVSEELPIEEDIEEFPIDPDGIDEIDNGDW